MTRSTRDPWLLLAQAALVLVVGFLIQDSAIESGSAVAELVGVLIVMVGWVGVAAAIVWGAAKVALAIRD